MKERDSLLSGSVSFGEIPPFPISFRFQFSLLMTSEVVVRESPFKIQLYAYYIMMNDTCWLADRYSEPLLQPIWDHMRERQVLFQSPVLAACIAFSVHVLFCVPYLVFDLLGDRFQWIHYYRIKSKIYEPFDQWIWLDCLGRIVFKYLTGVLPSIALFLSLRETDLPEKAPSCLLALAEILLCLLMFDTFFYIWHLLMHRVPWLFQKVHRAHHLNHSMFALAAQDASITELVSLQIMALVSAALVHCHPLSEALFHLLNTYLAIDDHCGYDLPWALHHLLPCFSGARYHQAHHQRYKGNYAPYFRHWDWIFGTVLTEDTTRQEYEANVLKHDGELHPSFTTHLFPRKDP
ncbi:hypothetical protein AALO_G00064710 [Alosa alosa]|uniref:Fatty acid hydroxylase domain-containing protein n=1 Tax=Alosa alosa TaxID=278164 RepID=A0AAV6H0M5_9TELE|nr:cholesterol 25-hydroxylase [Alosa alosa]KAG5280849.1 hypothetical protein AALO_G00064710 [Alosa alosa]